MYTLTSQTEEKVPEEDRRGRPGLWLEEVTGVGGGGGGGCLLKTVQIKRYYANG